MQGVSFHLPSGGQFPPAVDNANADFLGTHSLHGGGDLSWVMKAADAVRRWFERGKNRP